MKLSLLLILFLISSLPALSGEAKKSVEDDNFRTLLHESETAYALATAHLGSFKDSRINALSNRIQDDERVIQKALQDTARLRGFHLSGKTAAIPGAASSPEDFLRRQVELHEKILEALEKSTVPVLKNIKPRVERTAKNAKKLRQEFLEAQEESE
jgi:hypothetical protein